MIATYADAYALAESTAARLLLRLADVQASGAVATLALSGGGIGTKILVAARASPLRRIVDWRRVSFWWGDDRYVGAGDSNRNELQARRALLDHLSLAPDQVNAMPAAGSHASVAAATSHINAHLARVRPKFDVVLLGVGEDGHVASIFPGRLDLLEVTTPAVAVVDSPKPPVERISLSLAMINTADQVWLVASGTGKAPIIAKAMQPGSVLPAGLVAGTQETLWLLDHAAAAELKPRSTDGFV